MSEITNRIASLAVDAGMTVSQLAEAAGITGTHMDDFPERVAAGGNVSSLEVALVADFAGRDPLWVITGEWPTEALIRSMSVYDGLGPEGRQGFNRAWNAMSPFLPATIRDQAIAARHATREA